MPRKNPLQEDIHQRTQGQRNTLPKKQEKSSLSSKIGIFFSFLIALSVIIGLVLTLIHVFF